MKQSDARTAGRQAPPSFGRSAPDEDVEDFSIVGGKAIHVVVHAMVTPDAKSLQALRAAIREQTRAGVLDGYAAAFAEMGMVEVEDGGTGHRFEPMDGTTWCGHRTTGPDEPARECGLAAADPIHQVDEGE